MEKDLTGKQQNNTQFRSQIKNKEKENYSLGQSLKYHLLDGQILLSTM